MEHRASHSVANLDAVSPPRIANSLHEDLVYICRNVTGSEQAVVRFVKRHGTVRTPDSFELGFVRMDPQILAARAKPHQSWGKAQSKHSVNATESATSKVSKVYNVARGIGAWFGAHPHDAKDSAPKNTTSFVEETVTGELFPGKVYVQNMFLIDAGEPTLLFA